MIPLTKTLDPADLLLLTSELAVVDESFARASTQHPMRRWEYALALRAHNLWAETSRVGEPIYDVGGSGSPFYYMLDPYQVRIIDPKELHGDTLADFLTGGPRLGAAVFCLSVLEHVDDLDQFLYHLSCLVAPGGLLFLTMDYGDMAGAHPLSNADPFHFHWMRKRIFTERTWTDLAVSMIRHNFAVLGRTDWTYHGPHVYDYTFASLCLQKRS
jgi:SAM-dependent methyltransferase